jgi:hypothetical protein
MWDFHEVRVIATAQLAGKLLSLEKLQLATKYSMANWLREAVAELVSSETLIVSKEKAECLGAVVVAKLYAVRERLFYDDQRTKPKPQQPTIVNEQGEIIELNDGWEPWGGRTGKSRKHRSVSSTLDDQHTPKEPQRTPYPTFDSSAIRRITDQEFAEELRNMGRETSH